MANRSRTYVGYLSVVIAFTMRADISFMELADASNFWPQ